jgi:hypothetical protein
MVTITIPKKVTRGNELIIVPKREWKKLQKIAEMKISQLELEKGLKEALEEDRAGRIIGPFNKGKDLIRDLKKK